ncbi:hypothetical protein B1B04_24880 [Lysinibacillus sp. KCTC 33748]|uniref:hypothetical protein n=1 Tax=unclassified Lysinibacillus TaxID=2636778 RepID=UPI0009A8405A|nr:MULTISPECIES: hypothetical protein [unclassified Lysinibacillus]OXS65745.1 hypothetical protein B1B04_24880 [Lysinibacillus sp. KCTC 33748]SKC19408.1 hypothetical protein SAMN06295926_14310 [Lysinibacillus sp. AC-3]
MAIVGGNTEKKKIGLSIGVSGTHDKTMIDKTTGSLQLVDIDVDGDGRTIYVDQGSWTSDVIDLGDIFQDFEKVFTDNEINGGSTFTVLTRVSDNGRDWSDWVTTAEDGSILSDTKQYIQVRIDLFAGFLSDVFIISKSDFNINEFLEEKEVKAGSYIVPKLTSNTSSSEGFAFAETEYNGTYSPWKAFDKVDSSEGYCSKNGVTQGILGFRFKNDKRVTKYKIRSMTNSSVLKSMPKSWVLQGSNDTTDGINGSWYDLDTQSNQIWTTANTDNVYEISNKGRYYAYRIKFSENNGHAYSGIGEMDFYEEGATTLSLKRDYEYDMTLDSYWTDTGSLHRQKVNRSDFIKIDKLYIFDK